MQMKSSMIILAIVLVAIINISVVHCMSAFVHEGVAYTGQRCLEAMALSQQLKSIYHCNDAIRVLLNLFNSTDSPVEGSSRTNSYSLSECGSRAISVYGEILTLLAEMPPSNVNSEYRLLATELLRILSNEFDEADLAPRVGGSIVMSMSKVLYRLGRYEKAWRYVELANQFESNRQGYTFNKTTSEIQLAQATYLYKQEHFEQYFKRNRAAQEDDAGSELIFIVGFPYAHQKTLAQILNTHKRFFSMRANSKCIDTLSGVIDRNYIDGFFGPFVEEIQKSFLATMLQGARDEMNNFRTILLNNIKQTSTACLNKNKPLQQSKSMPLDLIHLDSSWFNHQHIGLIHILFPKAKFIHVFSNPIDSILAAYEAMEAPNYLGRAEFIYNLDNIYHEYMKYYYIMNHWNLQLPKGSIVKVFTEELENDLAGTLRRLFLDLRIPKLSMDTAMIPKVDQLFSSHGCSNPLTLERKCEYRPYLRSVISSIDGLIQQAPRSPFGRFFQAYEWCGSPEEIGVAIT